MFKVTANGENRLDIHWNGQIDGELMTKALDDLVQCAETVEEGVMLYQIDEISWPQWDVVLIKLHRLPQLFGLIGKFRKIAVVTDKRWLQKAAELEGWLLPSLEIKAFDKEALKQAEVWLRGEANQ